MKAQKFNGRESLPARPLRAAAAAAAAREREREEEEMDLVVQRFNEAEVGSEEAREALEALVRAARMSRGV